MTTDGNPTDEAVGSDSGELTRERARAVREYYRALDEHDYDLLTDLLAPTFVQTRPDRTLDGRDRFVEFMRSERPQMETSHPIQAIYRQHHGTEVVARGRLLDAEGEVVTAFVDVFSFDGNAISQIRTFTNGNGA